MMVRAHFAAVVVVVLPMVVMRIAVLVLMAVSVLVLLMVMPMFVLVIVIAGFILVVRVRRALVDAKLHALDVLPLLPVEVHVEVADIELRQLPFERGRLDAEIDERANGHIAGDAGKAVEEESLHAGKVFSIQFSVSVQSARNGCD
jgi:hypothetical protein